MAAGDVSKVCFFDMVGAERFQIFILKELSAHVNVVCPEPGFLRAESKNVVPKGSRCRPRTRTGNMQ